MTSPDIPVRTQPSRRSIIARQVAGFIAGALVSYALVRSWPSGRWPGRDVVALCAAIVGGNLVMHALTPPPRQRWHMRIAEVLFMAVLAGIILVGLLHAWQ